MEKTLRDEFAMSALQGLSAHPEFGHNSIDWLAEAAYLQADAMMKQREAK